MTNPFMLTPHFSLTELIRSDTAVRLHINNMPDKRCLSRLIHLCYYILEPARLALGEPVIVTSGYRCAALNRAVKGVAHSQHIRGMAADLRIRSHDYSVRLWNILKDNAHVDQLLWEHGKGAQWIHVSFGYLPRRMIDAHFCPADDVQSAPAARHQTASAV